MTDRQPIYEVHGEKGTAPIKSWTRGVPFEAGAKQQLINLAGLPFIHKWIAVMPDVHRGMGATIGSVVPTTGAIIPAAVGVDIGCGMMAARTSLSASDLPDSLRSIRTAIEAAVPHGRTDRGGRNDRGAWSRTPDTVTERWTELAKGYDQVVEKHPKLDRNAHPSRHLGTLGTGNHFIEVCLDEEASGLVHAPQRVPRGRQPDRHVLHRARQEGDATLARQPARPGPRLPGRRVAPLRRVRPRRRVGAELRADQPRADDGGGGGGRSGAVKRSRRSRLR